MLGPTLDFGTYYMQYLICNIPKIISSGYLLLLTTSAGSTIAVLFRIIMCYYNSLIKISQELCTSRLLFACSKWHNIISSFNSYESCYCFTQRGKVPIVCGGTAFYLKWLIFGAPDVPQGDKRFEEKAVQKVKEVRNLIVTIVVY